MSDEGFITFCSPTLAGIKVANLFSCDSPSSSEITNDIRSYNRRLSSSGVVVIPVKQMNGKTLIYVYRPKLLRAYLAQESVRSILTDFGYDADDMNACIMRMISRLKENEFPHEIGLFLGFPPEDVKGFIENNGLNYKVCGMWKVYGDVCKCSRLFDKYRMCTQTLLDQYRSGNTVERLTAVV